MNGVDQDTRRSAFSTGLHIGDNAVVGFMAEGAQPSGWAAGADNPQPWNGRC